MKHVITIDSLFEVMRLEAKVCGASYWQLKAIDQLEALAERREEFNPYRKAELDVEVEDGRLRVVISEADSSGALVANGEWTRMTFDVHGSTSMTTSHDPEWVEVLPAPT